MAEQRKIKIGDLEFNCRISGKENEELVVFLHGFPESSIMWTQLMISISESGFFCLAPDMRGYSEGACPKGIKNYDLKNLIKDILDLVDFLGKKKFHLVGHDWGAAIGWNIVYQNKERILSWTALSVPHSRAFGKAIKIDKVQQKKSSYIKWFLLPWLPEVYIRRNDFKMFKRLWKHSDKEEVEEYLRVFRQNKCLTGALNYYRANLGRGKRVPIGTVDTPTLFIWGNKDLAVGSFAAYENDKYVKGDYKFVEVEGGHWLVQTNFIEVEKALKSHLNTYKSLD
ncbi:alpha/beta hydrolase [Lutimonas zeaxanthinifaciens]|uniref:alpha/beta hydrolase n=1 Tax=Lutimonas zeaxanthinifaciens TaxID=3060215 RepID=UPI00265D1ADE|nr:alpha/beta hydrolase [Lutimonas sp. YSD2104]WKK67168.1 alpha/beta hydrolase [Lutimonas sp. YSD2104]